jgi:hypothetical protein
MLLVFLMAPTLGRVRAAKGTKCRSRITSRWPAGSLLQLVIAAAPPLRDRAPADIPDGGGRRTLRMRRHRQSLDSHSTAMTAFGRIAVGMVMVSLAACSGGPDLAGLGQTVGQTVTSAIGGSRIDAPPHEVYIRVARGAHQCWLGPAGPYRASHVFYAETASPTAKGGAGEILVHERDRTSERPWGPKAYRITFTVVDGQTDVGIENLRMPDTAAHMSSDVLRWAAATSPVPICSPAPVTTGAVTTSSIAPPPTGSLATGRTAVPSTAASPR